MKVHEKTFVPRLPEAGQKRLKSGGAHRNKNAYRRSAEKRNFERQVKDFK